MSVGCNWVTYYLAERKRTCAIPGNIWGCNDVQSIIISCIIHYMHVSFLFIFWFEAMFHIIMRVKNGKETFAFS